MPEERKISVVGENKVSENGKRKLSILSERLGRVVEEVRGNPGDERGQRRERERKKSVIQSGIITVVEDKSGNIVCKGVDCLVGLKTEPVWVRRESLHVEREEGTGLEGRRKVSGGVGVGRVEEGDSEFQSREEKLNNWKQRRRGVKVTDKETDRER